MHIASAQEDVRRLYRRGSVGQLVTALVWAGSAIVASQESTVAASMALFLGGTLIFPLTTVGLRLRGGPASLPKGHPMSALAFQLAMQAPLGLVVVLALAALQPSLLFPAAMVIVGAHYLPFVYLYGMRSFLFLSVPLIVVGVLIASVMPEWSLVGAWFTVAALLAFSVVEFFRDRQVSDADLARTGA
ncbi:DUF7010 family protein [Arthrobacter sp. NPDC092385]|uniref:DUF7010 family protein n=1 Tax=Arthrobacter sp. NPDC092385 TaxID=3363943 RepID=UPI003802B8E6